MAYALKYTDKDVRGDPSLLAIAVQYARSYYGEFDFLVAAAALIRASGTLPVPVARGVLNCMRSDPIISEEMPAPNNGHSEFLKKYIPPLITPFEFPGPPKSQMEDRMRREYANSVDRLNSRPRARDVNVPLSVKVPYMWTKNEFVELEGKPDKFHYISSDRGYATFLMPGMKFYPRIYSICGITFSSDKLCYGKEPPAKRLLCGSCDRQIETRRKAYAASRDAAES